MYTVTQWNNREDRDQRRRVVWVMSVPVLKDGAAAERINAFLERLASAFREWISDDLKRELDERYAKADRAGRMAFPADVRLLCLCREADDLFSAHFTAQITLGDTTRSGCASFVWSKSDGHLLSLSEIAEPGFAASHRGWSFYLAADGLRVYRTDRKGKMKSRERLPDIKTKFSS